MQGGAWASVGLGECGLGEEREAFAVAQWCCLPWCVMKLYRVMMTYCDDGPAVCDATVPGRCLLYFVTIYNDSKNTTNIKTYPHTYRTAPEQTQPGSVPRSLW